jgi:hypothetical protein
LGLYGQSNAYNMESFKDEKAITSLQEAGESSSIHGYSNAVSIDHLKSEL